MRIGIGTSIVGQQIVGGEVQYLDEVGGTPTAAYSVDKVVSTYTDAVVEVRRTVSAVTVEADVAFDGDTITLDSAVTITSGSSSATTLGEFVAASGYTDVDSLGSAQDAFVATWYDQAGSNDATQTTAANQPKIVSSGALVTENGKVALDFDGVTDFMQSPAGAITSTSVTSLTSFAVGAFNETGQTNDTFFAISNGSYVGSGQWFALRQLSGNNQSAVNRDGTREDVINGTSNTDQRLFYTNFKGSTSFSLGVDSSVVTETATVPVSLNLTQEIDIAVLDNGGTTVAFGAVSIQEIIIYDSDKSALRTDIEGNINGRFSIYT